MFKKCNTLTYKNRRPEHPRYTWTYMLRFPFLLKTIAATSPFLYPIDSPYWFILGLDYYLQDSMLFPIGFLVTNLSSLISILTLLYYYFIRFFLFFYFFGVYYLQSICKPKPNNTSIIKIIPKIKCLSSLCPIDTSYYWFVLFFHMCVLYVICCTMCYMHMYVHESFLHLFYGYYYRVITQHLY